MHDFEKNVLIDTYECSGKVKSMRMVHIPTGTKIERYNGEFGVGEKYALMSLLKSLVETMAKQKDEFLKKKLSETTKLNKEKIKCKEK